MSRILVIEAEGDPGPLARALAEAGLSGCDGSDLPIARHGRRVTGGGR